MELALERILISTDKQLGTYLKFKVTVAALLYDLDNIKCSITLPLLNKTFQNSEVGL